MKAAGIVRLLWVLLLAFAMTPLKAHERSESYSHWRYSNGGLSGIVTVRARESTRLTLPREDFGSLAEIFAAHVEKSISAAVDQRPCALSKPPYPLESLAGYIRVGVEMRCPSGSALEIHSDLFFEVAPAHDHFIYVENAAGTDREAILTVASRTITLDLKPAPAARVRFLQFVAMGIEHIGTGIDHLAFLLALLLTARSARQVLLIVTGFTVGHSLTLSLAVMGLIQANRTAVEALIGLTIALAAAGNLIRGEREGRLAACGAVFICAAMLLVPAAARPDMPGALLAAIALGAGSFVWLAGLQPDGAPAYARAAMAAGFGLVHGLGFASALQDLDLPQRLLLPTLVGFNLGVEIGQLAAVLIGVALLRGALRLWPAARHEDAPAAVVSAALLAAGTAWFLARSVTLGN